MNSLPNEKILRCPKDNDVLIKTQDSYYCLLCAKTWENIDALNKDYSAKSFSPTDGSQIVHGTKKSVAKFIAANTLVAFSAIALIFIQLGGLTSFADTAIETSKPTKTVSLVLWWLVFMLLFSIPVFLYWQTAIKKRPFSRSLRHYWIGAALLLVVLLELINILVVYPIFSF